jgi:hypothetical protein
VQGLNIWDTAKPANENTNLYGRHVLGAYAAHASTQHNNERLVKLRALVALTGKIEIMALVFVIASKDFMEESANQPAAKAATGGTEDNKGPRQCKRGNRSGKKKLFNLQQVIMKKESFWWLQITSGPRIG